MFITYVLTEPITVEDIFELSSRLSDDGVDGTCIVDATSAGRIAIEVEG